MKKYPAIAAIEFRDVSAGMVATDAMLKKAPIGFVKTGTITRGRFVALIGGTTASVDESFHEGLFWGDKSVIDSVMLADVHPQLHDGILGGALPRGSGSLAVVETPTVCATIRGIESALKGTPVSLISLRLADAGLSGKGISVLQGELHDIEAAVDIVKDLLSIYNQQALTRVLTSPHEAMLDTFAGGSVFASSRLVELEGETI